ncbi:LOW QUALITY PROTEIN: transmembrane protease serine 9-like [Liolophura sinensis]|uniref:LOW QUALITY PROTEIN: transmembrane protease serine 9-like n=1 Tax=Liolophura sinensis TaxID=3198878 RepID=UPI00315912B8
METRPEEGEVPWQLALRENGEFICGAALISPLWALTAAHCVDKHSNYNKTEPGFPNDIALIKFSRPFPVNDHIKPVVMASEMNNDFAGAKCAISGWGKLGGKFAWGDSGGPLVCDGVLIGVTSWGVDTCSANFPSVYSRVSHYRAWIDTVRATMRL